MNNYNHLDTNLKPRCIIAKMYVNCDKTYELINL